MIAASQLNRDVEKRAGSRRPQLSDLRESGSTEHDVGVLLFISREGMDDFDGADSCTAEVSVATQRNVTTGLFRLAFQRRFTKFVDLFKHAGNEARP